MWLHAALGQCDPRSNRPYSRILRAPHASVLTRSISPGAHPVCHAALGQCDPRSNRPYFRILRRNLGVRPRASVTLNPKP